jgi:hypothetical protein
MGDSVELFTTQPFRGWNYAHGGGYQIIFLNSSSEYESCVSSTLLAAVGSDSAAAQTMRAVSCMNFEGE